MTAAIAATTAAARDDRGPREDRGPGTTVAAATAAATDAPPRRRPAPRGAPRRLARPKSKFDSRCRTCDAGESARGDVGRPAIQNPQSSIQNRTGGLAMASFNKVILLGQPHPRPAAQVSAQPDGGRRSSAWPCNRKFRTQSGEDREEVTFVDCTAFGKTGRDHQPVLHQGQADLHRGPAEVRHVGRQAGRRQAQQAHRRRRELPVHRRPRRRRRRRWRRRSVRASGGGGGDGGGVRRSARAAATAAPAAAAPQATPRAQQPARRAALRRRTTVQGRRYSVLRSRHWSVVSCNRQTTTTY